LLIQGGNQFCALFPFLCRSGDIDCNANPEACGLATGCYNDDDCDGVQNSADDCPDHFGLGIGAVLDGCPLDWNGNGQPDEGDGDSDGTPNEMDACSQAPGSLENSGCPRPDEESIPLIINLLGFWTPNATFENFYCYVHLQDSAWARLPQTGSLPRSDQTYSVQQQVEIDVMSNQPLRMTIHCEGQSNPLAPVQDLGNLERVLGPQFWHCYLMDAWSNTGAFMAEYRICE